MFNNLLFSVSLSVTVKFVFNNSADLRAGGSEDFPDSVSDLLRQHRLLQEQTAGGRKL